MMAGYRLKVNILLLAAGQSLRMGAANKLIMPFQKIPMIRSVAAQLINANIGPVTIVTGFEAIRIEKILSGLNLSFCHNPDYETGQMSSVRAGCRSLRQNFPGTMIALSDMPFLKSQDYTYLSQQFFAQKGRKIVVPEYFGDRGNPIIIPQGFLQDIASGSLNTGCREILGQNPTSIQKVKVTNSAFVWDIDNPDEYSHSIERLSMPLAPCC